MTRKTDAAYEADRCALHFEAGYVAGKFAAAGTTSQPFVVGLEQARNRVVEAAKAWRLAVSETLVAVAEVDLFAAVAELERLEAEAQPKFPDGSPNLGLCPLCDGSGIWKSRMCQTCAGSGKS